MKEAIDTGDIYVPSGDVVARVIEDEIIIVPLTAGIGDLEDDLFTLNDIGRTIWEKLDGEKSAQDIVNELAPEYDGSIEEITADVSGFLQELLNRKMIVGKPSAR